MGPPAHGSVTARNGAGARSRLCASGDSDCGRSDMEQVSLVQRHSQRRAQSPCPAHAAAIEVACGRSARRSRRHRRRPQPGRVIGPTGRLGKAVETALDQYRLQTVVKHMTRRARHLRPAYHQVPLTILLLSHRHQRIPRSNQNVKESDQAACVQCRLRQRAANGFADGGLSRPITRPGWGRLRCRRAISACTWWATSRASTLSAGWNGAARISLSLREFPAWKAGIVCRTIPGCHGPARACPMRSTRRSSTGFWL